MDAYAAPAARCIAVAADVAAVADARAFPEEPSAPCPLQASVAYDGADATKPTFTNTYKAKATNSGAM